MEIGDFVKKYSEFIHDSDKKYTLEDYNSEDVKKEFEIWLHEKENEEIFSENTDTDEGTQEIPPRKKQKKEITKPTESGALNLFTLEMVPGTKSIKYKISYSLLKKVTKTSKFGSVGELIK
jgi:hypothetical protein